MNFIKENTIPILVSLVIALISASILLSYRNDQVTAEHKTLQRQTEQVKLVTQSILGHTMHGLDLGVRGFGHTKQEGLLQPYTQSVAQNDSIFINLESLLRAQQYDLTNLRKLRNEVDNYIGHCQNMVDLAKMDDMDRFKDLLNQDKGYDVWKQYVQFTEPVFAFEDQLNQQAQARYETTVTINRWVQFLLFMIGLPTLVFIVYRIRSDNNSRQKLLEQLEDNNRKYVFNSGKFVSAEEINPQQIVDASIHNFQKASDFISRISAGDYTVDWEGLNETNGHLNEDNITGKLIKMREQLKQGKIEEEKRLWINEGIAKFSEITRSSQHSTGDFAFETVKFLTKYLHAQQGSLFVLHDTDKQAPYLELTGCYAFDRKKYVKKCIEPGQGLVGQTFLEGQTTLLKVIPEGYTSITSGLGDATPTCLVVVPIKQNIQVEGIMELASFKVFEDYQISFLEKCGEIVASALSNAKTTEKMSVLIDELQRRTEDMRSQEEEIRQNMEELIATQEQQRRLQQEMEQQTR